MANNDRKQSSKFVAPRWGTKSYVFFSIVINLPRRYATKKYQEPKYLINKYLNKITLSENIKILGIFH